MGFLSKILNSFKSIRLNKANALKGDLLDHLLIGSMYAEQQSAYLNSYETGLNKQDVRHLVETYWEIYNQSEAIEILQSLHIRNQDENIDVVFRAFENRDNYVDILKSGLSNKEGEFDYYLGLFRRLNTVVPELIEQSCITNFAQLRGIKDSGWNYGRSVFLARCCYELGYLSESQMQEYLAKSYAGLKKYCNTWQEYTTSYIFGRAVWGGANNGGMMQIADDLLKNVKSPLHNKPSI
jgi:hypothetical protein